MSAPKVGESGVIAVSFSGIGDGFTFVTHDRSEGKRGGFFLVTVGTNKRYYVESWHETQAEALQELVRVANVC